VTIDVPVDERLETRHALACAPSRPEQVAALAWCTTTFTTLGLLAAP